MPICRLITALHPHSICYFLLSFQVHGAPIHATGSSQRGTMHVCLFNRCCSLSHSKCIIASAVSLSTLASYPGAPLSETMACDDDNSMQEQHAPRIFKLNSVENYSKGEMHAIKLRNK